MLPKPNSGETRSAFVARLMNNEQAKELFPDDDKRLEGCLKVFDDSTKSLVGNGLQLNKDGSMPAVNRIRHLMSNLIRRETMDNVAYLVCPSVLLVEGIMNNLFYGADECEKFPESWNGRPVVVDHPELMGRPISANSPEIVERQTVGQIFNTCWDPICKKLRSEVWINIEKCEKVAPEILTKLQNNECLEISTGLFTDCDGTAGTWNNQKFDGTVSNFRPDHLALLPNDKGACSWEDGGGLPRVNKDKDGNEIKETSSGRGALAMFKALGERFGFFQNDHVSHDDIFLALDRMLRATLEVLIDDWVFIQDVFDTNFVYVWIRSVDGTRQLFQQDYRVLDDGDVEFVGDPVEVVEQTEFVPVTNKDGDGNGKPDDRGNATNKKKEVTKMTRAEQISALIANSSDWEDGDQEGLLAMSDAQFAKVVKINDALVKANADNDDDKTTKATTTKVEKPAVKVDTNADDKVVDDKPKTQTTAEVIANIDNPAIRQGLERLVKQDADIKAGMIKDLTANKSCPFSAEQLEAKSVEELGQLLQLSGSNKPVTDYSAAAPAVNAESPDVNKDETPPMAELFPSKETAAA